MRKSALHFVIPNPEAFASGGNIYNQGLLDGLQSLGVLVKLSTQIDTHLIVDQEELLLVDTLFMEAFDPAAVKADCLLIVHHLPAMEEEALRAATKKDLEKYKGFLSTSPFTTNFLSQLGLTQTIITLLPALSFPIIPVSTTPSKSISQKVLIVANLIERKGILPFLKEWSQHSWPADFLLEIIGSPELEPNYATACHHFIQTLPPTQQKQINFSGSIPPKDVFQKYAAAQLLVSPASMETFGMAIQEAIACGLPVLLLQGGYAAQHLQQTKHGKAFPQLSELVAELKAWSQSSQLQRQYQQAAQKNAKQQATKNTNWTSTAQIFLQELTHHFPNKN